METTTGRIVAMASYPNYNPNVWTNGISQQEVNYLFGVGSESSSGEPAVNWATQGQYAPGSTFKVTSTAAAVANGFPLNGLYNCPASVNIGGHTFINDGEPSLGDMSFAEALIQSCDTVYYNIGYQMYQTDDPKANSVLSANAPIQKMQQMELDWGFGKDTGVDLPEESTGTIPTRQWLYNMWKDNAHKGQNWCKNGKANGSYVQQIEYEDCQNGWVWEPGQAAIAAIGQGYVTATPLQLTNAYTALANGGTLYEPRIGEALVSPAGQGGAEDQPAGGPPPARLVGDPGLHPLRAGRRGQPGHRGRRVRRLPAEPGLRGGQDRYRADHGQDRDLGVRVLRPVQQPQARGGRHAAELRLRRGRGGPGGPPDLGRHLRPRGQEGGDAGRHLPALPKLTATSSTRRHVAGRRVRPAKGSGQ